jgi:hypothetical protein
MRRLANPQRRDYLEGKFVARMERSEMREKAIV